MTTEDEAILNSITPQLKQAVTWSNSNIANKQEQALKHYKREPLPGDDKLKGKSKWVSPKVQQATDWCAAQLFRIFDSPQSVVEFCGIGPEDEAIAKQMNDTVGWILRTRNSSAAYLQPVFQDSLLTGLGVLTAEFTVETEESLPRLLKGVPNEHLVALNQQEEQGLIVIEEVGKPTTIPGPMGPIETRDLKIRTIKRIPRFAILPVAPEDLIISADAAFDPETGGILAKVQGNRKNVTRSDLLEMGFDREKVKELPAAEAKSDGIALERSKDLTPQMGLGPEDVTVYTIYTKLKIGKDRKSRLWRLTIGGDLENRPVLLDHTEVSLAPFAAFVCFPISHQLWGLGAADRLLDDHTLISKLYRGVLDSLSQSVNPIKVVNPDTTNVEDLLNSHAGAIVRSTDPSGGISYNKAPFAGADAIPVIDQLSRSLDMSTGTGESMLAIDASDLQRTSATAANLRSNASQLLIEGISRHLADTGYRYLTRIVISLLIDNPDEAAELFTRLTNQAIALDQFDLTFDLVTSVVFGTMSRDQSQGNLTNLLNQQYQALQAGLPIVNAQSIYSTLTKLVEGQGLKNTAPFLVDPSTLPPPPAPQPPPPSEAEIMAQAERLKAELKAQADAADQQFQMSKLALELDLKRDQMAQDFELKRAEIEAKYAAQVDVERLKLEQAAMRDQMGNINL